MILQLWIAVTGVIAIVLTQLPEHAHFACLFGLLSQPGFIYVTFIARLWGMLFLAICYTGAWGLGLYTYWIQ